MKSNTNFLKYMMIAVLAALLGLLVWMVAGQFTSGDNAAYETASEASEMVKKETVALTTAPEPETEAPTEPEDSDITLLFAGDVLLSDHVLGAYDQAGGIQGVLDENLLQVIRDADHFMVNQEFPFSERGSAAADKQYTFRLPPSRVHILQEMGIDMVTLANNHALDFGTDALLDTGTTLDQAGIRYVGAGENLDRAKKLETVEIKGKTIGFLGASRVIPVTSWGAGENTPGMLVTYDPTMVLEEIKKAKEICDYVVVYVHWGIERETMPETYQRTMGKQYIDAGADLVIGSHPHVLQGLEYYKGKPIVYSLGNFVFGSSIPKTMLLQATLGEDGISLRLYPATSGAGYTTMVTDPAKVSEFYSYITSLSFDVTVGEDGIVAAP
ncbi:MAG: CapA family protein [Lachnospiraceae bacterium]